MAEVTLTVAGTPAPQASMRAPGRPLTPGATGAGLTEGEHMSETDVTATEASETPEEVTTAPETPEEAPAEAEAEKAADDGGEN